MKLTKLKLCNFRSFGENEEVIEFNDLTTLIGNNSTGKTSAINAISKIFSEESRDRDILRSDFFLPKNVEPNEIKSQDLYIEVIFQFDELENLDSGNVSAVPTFFDSFVVEEPGSEPYLRVRLEASWQKDSSIEGSIESRIYYITCPEYDRIDDTDKKIANRHDLSQIKIIYVPAIRDPGKQLRNASGSMMYRLMNSINWKETTKSNIQTIIQDLNDEFFKESGVSIFRDAIHDEWEIYDTDSRYSNAQLKFNSTSMESVVKRAEVFFSPSVTGREYTINEMGDGLRSIFYISMVESMLDVENKIREEIKEKKELSYTQTPPILTIVAVEEPENHVAPHLLGKLTNKLRDISKKDNSQVILTSHSPSIIKRISPEDLRYLRLKVETLSSTVRKIILPNKEKFSDQYKYVKEAIQAYPELYFSKLIILGEGDSEEILLPKFFEVSGLNLDGSEISVVPLGGRHVNHFWRLLNDLKIPYITLLDLDKERNGGGWGRIKYVIKQLIKLGIPREDLLKTKSRVLSDAELDDMGNWDVTCEESMQSCIGFLEKYGVFFSSPLDIDFLMLEKFGKHYKSSLSPNEGPCLKAFDGTIKMIIDLETKLPKSSEYDNRILKDVRNTLKEHGGEGITYTEEQKKLMVWYNYFFLNRGKPSTHISVFSQLTEDELKKNIPKVIQQIMRKASYMLSGGEAND